ncbi:CopG family ribbon-helix-helix protein [Brucella gallinifaecis]|uniref:CopG family ribbon-helix-helix protein n=1 Tax=Brucella gallinifaecis TaxID=215590 RepID=UPI002362E587|nr:ribbon-helix-helix protein, CopG family [Brucella gallinifaecis]
MTNSVTVRLPEDVLNDIDRIADGTDRSRSYIIVRALKTYLMNEGADILASMKGRDQIQSGEYEDIDNVLADLERMVSEKAA